MTIRIADVLMQVRRAQRAPGALTVPSEITVVIPHAVVKRRYDKLGRVAEEELILDSITIVDSPRHEAGGRQLPLSPLPRATWRYVPGGLKILSKRFDIGQDR
jgi:hypothetical protein